MRAHSEGKPYNSLGGTKHSERMTLQREDAERGGMARRVGEHYEQRQKHASPHALASSIGGLSTRVETRGKPAIAFVFSTLLLPGEEKMRHGE